MSEYAVELARLDYSARMAWGSEMKAALLSIRDKGDPSCVSSIVAADALVRAESQLWRLDESRALMEKEAGK